MITERYEPKIELLPEHIIDQIKAGEVLERPASLIKELVENSIDAKSTDIQIHIIENGLDLISIEDNGTGMSFQNLPYAFLRHATSKIKKFDDLYRLHSYGFRGEALASIAASSRVTCQSQPQNLNEEGGKLIINGGIEELLVPMKNTRNGTSIYIKNLFYNTPARLKFIKSKTSERIQLKKMIYSFLISHPEINFSIKWDEKEKEVFKKVQNDNYLERFENIIYHKGKDKAPILKGNAEYEGHRVRILFTHEALKNSPNKHQYLFANDRLFFDKNLHQTIIRNTDSIWKYGESGHYLVLIDCPTEEIDVNVHPNKTQIKFSKNDIVYSLLVTAIKDAFKSYYKDQPVKKLEDQENYAPSFITENESRQFSLNELKDRTFDSRPNPSSPTQALSLNQTNAPLSNSIYELNSNYFIFNLNNHKYIAQKKLVLITYIAGLCQECLLSEDNISPLLISEPFQVKNTIDSSFETLKKIGFEFDRLNNEVIVLRTIPKRIHRELIKISAQYLINYFIQSQSAFFKPEQFVNLAKKDTSSAINLDAYSLYKLLESNQSELISISNIITDHLLDKIFNE